MSLIELRHVTKRFGRQVVLDHLSLNIEAGKCLVVIGVSGTGKSVLLKHIVGLLHPDRGEVWYDGKRIDTLPLKKLMQVRQEFGFLFQMGALFDSMTALENVAFPIREHARVKLSEANEIARTEFSSSH